MAENDSDPQYVEIGGMSSSVIAAEIRSSNGGLRRRFKKKVEGGVSRQLYETSERQKGRRVVVLRKELVVLIDSDEVQCLNTNS